MNNWHKFARRALVATAVVTFAAISKLIFLSLGQESGLLGYFFLILFVGLLFAPLWIGYLLVRRNTAGMSAIGFALGVIPPILLFVYYVFLPSGGISAVMSILFIPILAIVSGVVMAVLGAVLTVFR